jgi:predicted amidophosphoribosyltransferase
MKAGRLVDLHPLLDLLRPRLEALATDPEVALIAVPPHLGRLTQRGLHLPDLLAGGLTATGRRVVRALARQDDLAPRRDDRQAAPQFTLRIAGLGRPALLVDDVVTTGATLQAAASVLLDGGWNVRGALCLADARPGAIRSALDEERARVLP